MSNNPSLWQYFLPQHALSRMIGWLANSDSEPVKNTFIQWFVKRYQVDMSEALQENPLAYATFNDFFTRELKKDARTIASGNNVLVSPADGTLSEFGDIADGKLLQAKGQEYTLAQLLANDAQLVQQFDHGSYATIYLAPRDYHRVHMPLAGKLTKMIHVPGKLFSVNFQTAQDIPSIFARNERVICVFDTEFGPMAVILVGAMIVASIATAWHGQVTPKPDVAQSWGYQSQDISLDKGAEVGRFYLGSTAIVLMPKGHTQWQEGLVVGQTLKMGQQLAEIQ